MILGMTDGGWWCDYSRCCYSCCCSCSCFVVAVVVVVVVVVKWVQVRDLYLMISDLTDGGQILGYISATGHLDTQQQGIQQGIQMWFRHERLYCNWAFPQWSLYKYQYGFIRKLLLSILIIPPFHVIFVCWECMKLARSSVLHFWSN